VAGAGAVGERVGTTTRSSITATFTWGTATGGEVIDRARRATDRVIQAIVRVLQVIVPGIPRIGRGTLAIGQERTHRQTRLAHSPTFHRAQQRIHRQVARTVCPVLARPRQPHRDPVTQQRKPRQTAENCAATQAQPRTLRTLAATPFRGQGVSVCRVRAGNKA